MGLFSRNASCEVKPPVVRPATAEDADTIVRFVHALSLHDGGRVSRLTRDTLLRDGFGPDPAFSVLLAEVDGAAAGFALYFAGYDTDRAARGVYMSDLYVEDGFRRRGVGRALIRGVAAACRENGGKWMFWSVLKRNRNARRFYRTVAPELKDVVLCAALGDSFELLATGNRDCRDQ